MSHLIDAPKDISILKAYWVNHGVDYSDPTSLEFSKDPQQQKSNRRQACVGVYGVDIHPDGTRFATCGADEKIKIWSMAPIIEVNVEITECVDKLLCVCKYDKKQNANSSVFNNTIHCVKWSHNGKYLASGAADGIVTIWSKSKSPHIDPPHHQNNHNSDINNPFSDKNQKTQNIENWVIAQQLTKHRDEASSSNTTLTTDVQDLVWSPNDQQLISAGSDHNIIIWSKIMTDSSFYGNSNSNTNSNSHQKQGIFQHVRTIKDAHHDMILGVSFDPLGEYLLSQSADGTAKIWQKTNNYHLITTIQKDFKPRSHFIRKNTRDDLTRLDVCQRGSWSPDGMYVATSFGIQDGIFISPIYHRTQFADLISMDLSKKFSFVGHAKPTTVTKWNPRIYQDLGNGEIFFIAAVGSMDRTVSIWATNSDEPLMLFRDIGKESILDLSWSRTGDILLATTHDGNVMAYIFGKDAFGGYRLSINQHCDFVKKIWREGLDGNVMNYIRNNITLCQGFKFNQVKPIQDNKEINDDELNESMKENMEVSVIENKNKNEDEQKETVLETNGNAKNTAILIDDDEDEDDDIKMKGLEKQKSVQSVTSSQISDYVPAENVFGPEEGEEKVDIGYIAKIEFDAIESKEKKPTAITDYYQNENDQSHNHNHNHNVSIPSQPSTPIRYDNNHNHNGSIPSHSNSARPPALEQKQDNDISFTQQKKQKREMKKDKKKDKKKKKKKKKKERLREPNESGIDGDAEMDDNISVASLAGKKRRHGYDDHNEPRKKKRKYGGYYHEKLIEIKHPSTCRAQININDNVTLRCESNRIQSQNRKDEIVCELVQNKIINGRQYIEWKTEIPNQVTQISLNKTWTICGTIDGELYCFNSNGRLVMSPVQMEEDIVLLHITSGDTGLNSSNLNMGNGGIGMRMMNGYRNHNGNPFAHHNDHSGMYENEHRNNSEINHKSDVFLLIITSDCTLRQWKLKPDIYDFDPIEVVKTDFSSLIKTANNKNNKHSKDNKSRITLKQAFSTNDGKIILKLSNNYIYTHKLSLNSWLRVSDDKYWLSNERKSSGNHNRNDNNNNDDNGKQISNLSMRFSELLSSMHSNGKELSLVEKTRYHQDTRKMHTISHLEQLLSSLPLFGDRVTEFENLMQKYVEQLIESLSSQSLSFGTKKLNEIFNSLLNWNHENNHKPSNKWPGSVIYQRKLLEKLLKVVENKMINDNNVIEDETNNKLHQLINKYNQALNACNDQLM